MGFGGQGEDDRLEYGDTHISLFMQKEDLTCICLPDHGDRSHEIQNRAIPRFRRFLAEHGIEEIRFCVADLTEANTRTTERCTCFILDAGRDRYWKCKELWEQAVEDILRRDG